MGFYNDRVLPHVINLSMRNRELRPYRERVVAQASGRVLEIGVGSGLNLPLYGMQVKEIVGVEPAPRLIRMAQNVADQAKSRVTFIAASAESLPVDTASVDTIVTTWTLCSIPDVVGALKEMRRVLRDNGQLLFVEHGLAPEENVQVWQNRLTPLWKKIGGGCHLNRPIRALIEHGGFAVTGLKTGYMKGPKPMTYLYEGRARPS
jgi:ubiquinone/menaquinone biosynthesis C-methylase UbiE